MATTPYIIYLSEDGIKDSFHKSTPLDKAAVRAETAASTAKGAYTKAKANRQAAEAELKAAKAAKKKADAAKRKKNTTSTRKKAKAADRAVKVAQAKVTVMRGKENVAKANYDKASKTAKTARKAADRGNTEETETTGVTITLPVLPSELPEVSRSADSDEFLSVGKGYYNVIGQPHLNSVAPDFLLPDTKKPLRFTVSNLTGAKLIGVLNKAMNKRRPLKYTVAKASGGVVFNSLVAVADYSWKIDKKNDYVVKMTLNGWKEYSGWSK